MKTLSIILAAAALAFTAVGCASHEKASTSTYGSSMSVTSK
jgi:outer membrane lipoprotein SlyB